MRPHGRWLGLLVILVVPMLLAGCTTTGATGGGMILHTSLRSQHVPEGVQGSDLAQRSRIHATYDSTQPSAETPSDMPRWLKIGGDIEVTYMAYDFGAFGRQP